MTRPIFTVKDKNNSECEIKLNGELLKLKSYSIERHANTVPIITLELGYHNVEIEKEIQFDDVVYLKWRGMIFKRVSGDIEVDKL